METKIDKLLDLYLDNKINTSVLNSKQEQLKNYLDVIDDLLQSEKNTTLSFDLGYIKKFLST